MVNLPFFKKKAPQVIPGRSFVPFDRVREMAARGFSEPEMIDVLRREGFSPEEIDKALTSALQTSVTGEAGPNTQPAQQSQPSREQSSTVSSEMFPNLTPTTKPAEQQEVSLPQVPETSLPEDYSSYSTEDYVDYAVQNRLADVNETVSEIEKRNKELSSKIEQLQKKIDAFSAVRGQSSPETAAKIENFVDTITEVDARVGSLEKAFKETLPALIQSVRSLSDVVQKAKKEEVEK